MPLERPKINELINVHRVIGEKPAIIFLKNSEKDYVEGLFFQAKHMGTATFFFRDLKFEVIRNKDYSFTIRTSQDQELNAEQFA